jgi:hypothetical protein
MPWGLKRFHHTGQSHFVTFCCYHRSPLLIPEANRRVFEQAQERVRQNFSPNRLWLRRHARTCALAARRTAMPNARRCAEVPQARSRPALDQRRRPLLAKALLRFQHPQLRTIHGKAPLHSLQPSEERIMRTPRGLAVEQFSPLRNGLRRRRRD